MDMVSTCFYWLEIQPKLNLTIDILLNLDITQGAWHTTIFNRMTEHLVKFLEIGTVLADIQTTLRENKNYISRLWILKKLAEKYPDKNLTARDLLAIEKLALRADYTTYNTIYDELKKIGEEGEKNEQ